MSKSKKINEYEAAIEFGFSPELLRWFTKNPIIDEEKLPFKEVDGLYFFRILDLHKINKKMLGKWPLPAKGTRPTIPAGIKREIKEEAQFSCPVCHRPQGELAHIRPVSKTYCNHPNNLIFLCPNHHSEYDYGYIYENVNLEDVKAFKDSLARFKKLQWSLKGQIIQTYLGALNTAKSLLEINDSVRKCIDDSEFEKVLNKVTASINKKRKKTKARLKLTVENLEAEIKGYTTSHSKSLCPLCHGKGSTSFYDPCPVCLGNGELTKGNHRLDRLDDYTLIDCRLCEGTGRKDGDDCPVCLGECQIPQGLDENHDWSQYELVDCRICQGLGRKDGDDCPVCLGDCQIPQGMDENHDWSQYELIDCRLCEGLGRKDGDDCPVCLGDCQIPQGMDENHDWSQYELVDCRLCEGTGRKDGDDCPVCLGDCQIPQGLDENHDWSQYELVDCRLCEGTGRKDGDDCSVCLGDRQIPQGLDENHDWTQYELVDCRLCDGAGRKDGDDCPVCLGNCQISQGLDENHDWSQYH